VWWRSDSQILDKLEKNLSGAHSLAYFAPRVSDDREKSFITLKPDQTYQHVFERADFTELPSLGNGTSQKLQVELQIMK
jgi:hypothetical protein